mmetsp:Transcript_30049/g.37013  ORF Transcript_30049/g.37013 Transcript_30049/m.37013 type:complete len:89 (-) Transcript_30049:150-416(-)
MRSSYNKKKYTRSMTLPKCSLKADIYYIDTECIKTVLMHTGTSCADFERTCLDHIHVQVHVHIHDVHVHVHVHVRVRVHVHGVSTEYK